MLAAQYQYVAKYPQSISFNAGDHFLGLRKENNHWLYVYHEKGVLGSIPINYVQESNLKTSEEVSNIINKAINAIHNEDIFEKEIILTYLKQLQNGLKTGVAKSNLPSLPVRHKPKPQLQPVDKRSNGNVIDAGTKQTIRSDSSIPPMTHTSPVMNSSVEKKMDEVVKAVKMPPKLSKPPAPAPPSKQQSSSGTAFLMLDKLRNCTQTSYDRCVFGFVKMLEVLADADPAFATLSNDLINEIQDKNSVAKRTVYVRMDDWKLLQNHMNNLEKRAKDLQESSWPLAEDDSTVIHDLDSFIDLLCNLDSDMTRTAVSTDLHQDDFPRALSYLFQREKRSLVRRFYLLIIVALCHIHDKIWSIFIESCIPMEIIREIGSSQLAELDLILDLRVLTILLTKSNALPIDILNVLDETFFDTVFARVSKFLSGEGHHLTSSGDSESKSRPSDLLLDTFLQFVCAANRHFLTTPKELTPILKVMLGKHLVIKDLVERLLFLFNRCVEPLNLDGVSFVKKIRGTLGESFDLSSDLYNGYLLYKDPNGPSEDGLYARARNFSSGDDSGEQYGGQGNGFGGGDSAEIPRLKSRPSLTKIVLENASDTPVNSARKLLADIFSSRETAILIYRNDVNVVIDVIIRQICDLPANSPSLPEFLYCMDKVIRNTDCMSRSSGPYRLDDLVEALQGVEYSAQTTRKDFTVNKSISITNDLLTLLNAMRC